MAMGYLLMKCFISLTRKRLGAPLKPDLRMVEKTWVFQLHTQPISIYDLRTNFRMEQVRKQRQEKWVIIPLKVERSQLVQIEHRMPSSVFHCTGVFVSIYGVKGYYLPTRFGEVSLQFNDRASHPVHLPGTLFHAAGEWMK